MRRSDPPLPASVRRVLVAVLATVALVLTACGGSADPSDGTAESPPADSAAGPAPEPAAPPTTAAATTTTGLTTTAVEEAPSGSPGTNQASVTIGDRTYRFTVQCQVTVDQSAAGTDVASSQEMDDGRADLSFELYDIDTDTPSRDSEQISVTDLEGGQSWRADFDTEGSGIISTSIDGSTVSGRAVFVDTAADSPSPVRGTFDIVCGEG